MEDRQLKIVDVIEKMCAEKNVVFRPMRLAADIMNSEVKTLTLDHNVEDCLKFMQARKVRHVPVVDLPYENEEKPFFIGVVSQRDVLRLNVPDADENAKQKIDQTALRQLLVQVVARNPHCASPKTPVLEVITTMVGNHVDIVPVLDGGDLVGIITTTDLIKFFLRLDKLIYQLCPDFKHNPAFAEIESQVKILFLWIFRTVQEIMTKEVVCLQSDDELARAVEVLKAGRFRHIPVVDKLGKLVGIISDRDILRHLPFAGRRPPKLQKSFRDFLFSTEKADKNLKLPLNKIMTRKILHILPDCTVGYAADILHKKKISCLPVIDKNGDLKGIVTVTDLLRALLTAYEPAQETILTPGQGSIC